MPIFHGADFQLLDILLSNVPVQLIRCTAKLRKEMGLKKTDLCEGEPVPPGLGQWHAHLIYIMRKKCVLFVNDRTLLNFIQPDVRREQIRKLDELFREMLPALLSEKGLTPEQVDAIMSDYETITYGKSNNRSVLGSMNDLAYHYEIHLKEAGSLHSAMVPSIIMRLNRMPMGGQDYATATEALRDYVDENL